MKHVFGLVDWPAEGVGSNLPCYSSLELKYSFPSVEMKGMNPIIEAVQLATGG